MANGGKFKNTLALDPVCLSCTQMQSDIIKQFKIACLAYAPSPVAFRNVQFQRHQLLTFRKFLMGQCSKIVHLKEPYRQLGMSTKRIFDDMYLFLREANDRTLKDDMNGLPHKNYQDVTAQYWNLIYKQTHADEGQ